jgi:hypothetical protein
MKPQNRLVHEDGKLYDESSVEVDGIFEGAAALKEVSDHNPNASKRYLGSIDMITARIWSKECGAKMFSKEWMAYARKMIQSGDYALFFPQSSRKAVHNGSDIR